MPSSCPVLGRWLTSARALLLPHHPSQDVTSQYQEADGAVEAELWVKGGSCGVTVWNRKEEIKLGRRTLRPTRSGKAACRSDGSYSIEGSNQRRVRRWKQLGPPSHHHFPQSLAGKHAGGKKKCFQLPLLTLTLAEGVQAECDLASKTEVILKEQLLAMEMFKAG